MDHTPLGDSICRSTWPAQIGSRYDIKKSGYEVGIDNSKVGTDLGGGGEGVNICCMKFPRYIINYI